MKIVLLGAPGAGKGTQAKKLAEDFGYVHVSTGDMLRAAVAEGTDLGKKAKEYMDAGNLVPDDIIIGLVKDRLQNIENKWNFILDGFPRNAAQADALDAALAELNMPLDAALLIDVPQSVIVERLTSRRMCKDCGHIGSKADTKCPECGGEMYQRDDDNEMTVRNRLSVYETTFMPLLEHYNKNQLLVKVDGARDFDAVYADVKKALYLA